MYLSECTLDTVNYKNPIHMNVYTYVKRLHITLLENHCTLLIPGCRNSPIVCTGLYSARHMYFPGAHILSAVTYNNHRTARTSYTRPSKSIDGRYPCTMIFCGVLEKSIPLLRKGIYPERIHYTRTVTTYTRQGMMPYNSRTWYYLCTF